MTEVITATTPYLQDTAFPIYEGANRLERAMQIMKHPKSIKKVSKGVYSVKSQFSYGTYVVNLNGENPTYTCPDFQKKRTDL